MPVGYHLDGRRTRCYDRFVRYPYPSMATSYYQKEFAKKTAYAKCHKKAFNMEKESKIINPHKMEMETTMRQVHNGERGQRSEPKFRDNDFGVGPIQLTSSYQ